MKLTRDEENEIDRIFKEQVWGSSEVEDAREKRDAELRDLHKQGKNALEQADKASRRGDLGAAKKWTDVSERMIAAFRRLDEAELPSAHEDEETLRADIRARVAKFCDDDIALQRWEMRQEIWQEMADEAAREGRPPPPPMPPRPPNWTDALPAELAEKIREGGV